MKLRFSILLLLSLIAVASSAQRNVSRGLFTENTELRLLNPYAEDFNIKELNFNQREKIISDIASYIRSYHLTSSALQFYSGRDSRVLKQNNQVFGYILDSALHRDKMHSILLNTIESFLKEVKSKEGLPEARIPVLNFTPANPYPTNDSIIKEIENTAHRETDRKEALYTNIYLAYIYLNKYSQDTFQMYNHISTEKALYYLHRAILVCDDPRFKYLLLDKLISTQGIFAPSYYNYMRMLPASLKAYESAKRLKDNELVQMWRWRILMLLQAISEGADDLFVLPPTDQLVLNQTILKFLENELKADKQINNIGFFIIGDRLAQIDKHDTSVDYSSEIEKAYILGAITSYMITDYGSFGMGFNKSLSVLKSDNKQQNRLSQIAYFDRIWNRYIDYASLTRQESTSLSELVQLDKYHNRFMLIRNLLLNEKQTSAEKILIGELKSAFDSAMLINSMINQYQALSSANAFYSNLFNQKNTRISELLNEVDSDEKLRKIFAYALKDHSAYDYLKLANESKVDRGGPLASIFQGELNAVKDENEKQIIAAKNKDILIIVGGSVISAILLVLAVVFIIKRQRYKMHIKNLSVELRAAKSSINAHFMRNIFVGAIGSRLEHTKQDEVIRIKNQVRDFLSDHYDYSQEPSVPLIREIEYLQRYIDLEYERFYDRFSEKPRLVVDSSISDDELSIMEMPSMLVQPFIENAFKYGLREKDNNFSINLNKSAVGCYSFIMHDSGNGMSDDYVKHYNNYHPKALLEEDALKGIGTCLRRIYFHNKQKTAFTRISSNFHSVIDQGLSVTINVELR